MDQNDLEVAGVDLDVDVLLVGPVYCDLIFGGLPHLPGPGTEVFARQFAISPGGTATRCAAVARLGASAGLVSAVGTDLFGGEVMRTLSAIPGTNLTWVRRDAGIDTPVTVAAVDAADRSFITYEHPAWSVPRAWPGPGPAPRARACHVGADEPLPGWILAMRAAGTTVVGGVGWDATGAWSPDVLERLGSLDVFCPNAHEAMRYTRTGSAEQALRVLAGRVPLTVITKGDAGAIAFDAGTGEAAAVPATAAPPNPQNDPAPAIDPTGAGDVFVASFIVAGLQEWTLAERLRFAAVCAGLSVRRLGGATSAPDRDSVRSWVAGLPAAERRDYRFLDPWLGRDGQRPLPGSPRERMNDEEGDVLRRTR